MDLNEGNLKWRWANFESNYISHMPGWFSRKWYSHPLHTGLVCSRNGADHRDCTSSAAADQTKKLWIFMVIEFGAATLRARGTELTTRMCCCWQHRPGSPWSCGRVVCTLQALTSFYECCTTWSEWACSSSLVPLVSKRLYWSSAREPILMIMAEVVRDSSICSWQTYRSSRPLTE